MDNNFQTERRIWQKPWSYIEAFLIAAGIAITGWMLEYISSGFMSLPQWPYNFLFGIFLIIFILTVHLMYRKYPLIRFLSGTEASIAVILFYTILVLLMGFIPQSNDYYEDGHPLGLGHIKNSWPFILISLYLLIVLGLVILRRIFSLKKKKLVFIINHSGLWLIIFVAGISSGDLQRYHIEVHEGESTSLGYNNQTEAIKLPFEIKLLDFNIDEFPARLALVDYKTQEIDANHNPGLIEKAKTFKIKDFIIDIKEYIPSAIKDSTDNYIVSNDSLAVQAAKLIVKNKSGQLLCEGWISSGSPRSNADFLEIDNDHVLSMTLPEPKRFSSKLIIKDSKGLSTQIKLEVNKPYSVDGWKIYQTGYDTRMGKYSTASIIEAVKDPWMPVVYAGLILLLSGSLLLFYYGRN